MEMNSTTAKIGSSLPTVKVVGGLHLPAVMVGGGFRLPAVSVSSFSRKVRG